MVRKDKQKQRATAPTKRRFDDCSDSKPPEQDVKRLNTGGSSCEAGPSTSGSSRMKRRFDAVEPNELDCGSRPFKRQKVTHSATVASSSGSSSSGVSLPFSIDSPISSSSTFVAGDDSSDSLFFSSPPSPTLPDSSTLIGSSSSSSPSPIPSLSSTFTSSPSDSNTSSPVSSPILFHSP